MRGVCDKKGGFQRFGNTTSNRLNAVELIADDTGDNP
jgi:hypothetical protein